MTGRRSAEMSQQHDRPGDQPGPTQTGEVPCPACGGSGKTGGTACKECEGTGQVRQIVGDA